MVDDYIACLHDALVSFSGGNFGDAQSAASAAQAAASNSLLVSQQPDVVMSTSTASGESCAVVGPSRGTGRQTSRSTNFSFHEDIVLCKSWLGISNDPITNTGQRKEAFWVRIMNRYNSECKNYPARSQKSLSSRWDFIKADVMKFSSYVVQTMRLNPSGMSDADKLAVAATKFAGLEKHNFTLMHCYHILKNEPKFHELNRNIPHDFNSSTIDLNLDPTAQGSTTKKRPMGRDAAKAEKKKASFDYAAKIHDLSVEKISLFKDCESDRKARLDDMIELEKVKAEEAREHRKTMIEFEKERLELDRKHLQIEAEKKEKDEDERILAINLDQCLPFQRMHYQALQEDIIEKPNARRRPPNL